VNDQLTTASETSPDEKDSVRRLFRDRRVRIGGLVVLAAVVVAAAWVLLSRGSSSTSPVSPIEPVALSASGLVTLTHGVRQPIYWAGPRNNYLYELRRTSDGTVYVRYLPPGVDVGAKGAKYLVIATYPFKHAYEALQNVAGGRGVRVPGGGLALVDAKDPKSVHLAFPGVDFQAEVFDPSPKRALEIASSGQVHSAG